MKKVNLGQSYDNRITLRLPEELLNKIDKLSRVLNKDRSEVIRMILNKSLIYVEGAPEDGNKIQMH